MTLIFIIDHLCSVVNMFFDLKGSLKNNFAFCVDTATYLSSLLSQLEQVLY